MNDIGISRDATRFQELSETGEAAVNTAQNQPTVYDLIVDDASLPDGEKDKNTVGGPQLQDPGTPDSGDLGGLYDRFNATTDNFEVGMTEIFSVLHEAALSLKKSAKEVRGAERELQQTQLQDAADKLRNAATYALASGIVSGSMQIAGGVTSIGGAAASARTTFGKPVEGPLQLNAELPQSQQIARMPLEQRIQVAQQRQAYWTGSAQVVGGTGDMMGRVLDSQGKQEEAQKAELDAEATRTGAAVEDSNQLVQDLAEMLRDVRSKLAEIESANNETMQKALQV